MNKQELTIELTAIIEDYLKAEQVELFDLSVRYQGQELLIQALVDKPCGGISIDECASINKGLYALLEKKGIIDRAFTIEIFSPGLDRPLRSRKDFLRTTGKDVRFFLLEPVNGKIELEGTIISVGEETVGVKAGENVIEVPLEKIRMGKQVY